MSITVVTRFKINREEGLKLAREGAPMLKAHGAMAMRLGYCYSGEYTGQTVAVLIYSDWEAYGRAMEARAKDASYQALFAQVLRSGELVERTIMETQEL
ncbi:MAG TPA: hypothetical protein VMB73_01785 [Acetobacteraceae bacterium]|nr:hypothetical protein [Acetobacteraceae bacterium]